MPAPTPPTRRRVVVVDDNEDVLTAVRLLLGGRGYDVATATSPEALPALLQEGRPAAVLLDMNFRRDASSGKEGLFWLDRLLDVDPTLPVVMITAYGEVELAVQAMKRGAVDFVTKPWSNEQLVQTVAAAQGRRRQLETVPEPGDALEALLGESQAMQEVVTTLRKVAPTDANVLILGENGTGKELAARAIHSLSRRSAGPFVAVDLGALTPSLFESELFGHAKGAYTGAERERAGVFEAASGGTLFLDEVGNVEPAQQQKLLSVLQRREVVRLGTTTPLPVDVRIVSATNRPLAAMAQTGEYRQDLLYRLNTVELRLPPLRDRAGDVDLLARHFLRRYAAAYGRGGLRLSDAALVRLRAHPWPGNVRELQHTIERAVILADGDELQPADLLLGGDEPSRESPSPLATFDLEEIERDVIRRALATHGGNITHAAEALGLTRKSLYRRIEKYGL
jgi:two-component system, NtrC family, response regulator HydG